MASQRTALCHGPAAANLERRRGDAFSLEMGKPVKKAGRSRLTENPTVTGGKPVLAGGPFQLVRFGDKHDFLHYSGQYMSNLMKSLGEHEGHQ